MCVEVSSYGVLVMRIPYMDGSLTRKERSLMTENLANLRQIYEMRKQIVDVDDLAPHHRIAAMREFNIAYDEYNDYLGEIIARLGRVTGPEIERANFRHKPPSQFREVA